MSAEPDQGQFGLKLSRSQFGRTDMFHLRNGGVLMNGKRSQLPSGALLANC